MTTTTSAVLSVDARRLPQGTGPHAALAAFEELRAGEVLDVRSEEDLTPLLRRLRDERPGQFEWTPLGDDPGAFHVEIQRREAGEEPGRLVTDALRWDHERLAALEHRAFAALERGDLDEASRLYRTFVGGLNRHIRVEEELLFPLFEARTGAPGAAGPTAVMRSEHRQIRMLLADIERNVDGAEVVAELREALRDLLAGHEAREDRILYPAIDRVLGPIDSDRLVARIQEFSA